MTYYEEQMFKEFLKSLGCLAKAIEGLAAAVNCNNEQLKKSCELAAEVHQSTKQYIDAQLQ